MGRSDEDHMLADADVLVPYDLFEARLKRDGRSPSDTAALPFLSPFFLSFLFVPVAMAPSVLKHRFQNSLDMVAARSMRNIERAAQAGTEDAWCIVDSPTLGRLSGALKAPSPVCTGETAAPLSQLPTVAPLNIKKARRRGLSTGIRLVLPPSPSPLATSFTGSNASMALSTTFTDLAFTAEWDLTQSSFVFTPLETSCTLSSASSHYANSPVPCDVDWDALPLSPAFSAPSQYSPSILDPHPILSAVRTTLDRDRSSSIARHEVKEDEGSQSSATTPVSSIFDRGSIYLHGGQTSRSTAASSVISLVDVEFRVSVEKQGPWENVFNTSQQKSADNPLPDQTSYPREQISPLTRVRPIRKLPVPPQPSTALPQGDRVAPRRIRKLPDVPRSAESMYCVSSSSPDAAASPSRSLRRQLSAQITKALGNTIFKR